MTEQKTTEQEVQEAQARQAADALTTRLEAIAATTTDAEKDPTLAADALADQELAGYVALLQDIRHRLGLVERDLTTALGKRLGKTVGSLADGRQFTVDRMADRKEWNHEDWKRDARRAVVQKTLEDLQLPKVVQILTEDGEVTSLDLAAPLYQAITEAQEVHGAQAPRSRSLKALGLFATDYCTSTPGGWRFNAIKPTTKEDTTDA